MKNLFLAFLLSGVIFHVQCQTKSASITPADLMKKSDSQYTAGWILLGGGTAMVLTAWAIPYQNDDYSGTSSNNSFQEILGVTGTLSIIVSVPIFLSSGNNARMAARLSLQNQALLQPVFLPGQSRNFPALNLKIPL